MMRSRDYINELCPISGQSQHVTVYFKPAVPAAKALKDYKRDHFVCDNELCELRCSHSCPIYYF